MFADRPSSILRRAALSPVLRSAWLLPALVLAIGWTTCAVVVAHAWRKQREADSRDFVRVTTAAEEALVHRFETYTDALEAAASFVRELPQLDRTDWRDFAGSLDLDHRYPGICGLGLVYPVQRSDVPSFVARVRADNAPEFTLRPVPGGRSPGDEYAIVTFIEPAARNQLSAGLDLYSEPRRRAAAIAARDSGEPRLTGRVTLVQDGLRRPGAVLFVPVYRAESRPDTVTARRAAHQAWVSAPFVIEELFAATLGGRTGKLCVDFYEGAEVRPESVLYRSDPRAAVTVGERVTHLQIAGVPFTLVWNRGPELAASPRGPYVYATAAAAIGVALLAGLVWSVLGTSRRAQVLARELTRDMAATQAELEAVMRLQRGVLDGAPYGIIGTRPNGVITLFNAAAERMLGYAQAEVVGSLTPLTFHLDAEVRQQASDLTRRLQRTILPGFEALVAPTAAGRTDEREWTYVRRDGTRVPVLLTASAQCDATGDVTGYLFIAHDLTARKQAQDRAVRTQRLLETVTSILPGMAAYWTTDLQCAFSNDGYVSWFGRTAEEMKTINLRDLLGEELFRLNEPYIRGVLAGHPQHFERVLRMANGDPRHTWAQYIPDFEADKVTVRGFLALISDVTDMKRQEEALRASEAKLRASLQEVTSLKTALDAHAIVAITDADGVITYANDRFCTVSGYGREELLGHTHRVINSGRHDAQFFADMWTTITAGRIWRGEICNRAKDGRLYWVDATIVPFVDEAGNPTQYIAIRTDITERKQLEGNLAEARDQALEASRLKSEFLATMSHEIRTPMNAIIGMAGILSDAGLNAEHAEMVRTITTAAESLLTIINDILDFSRIESGRLRLDLAEFDLARVLEDSVTLLAPKAHEKGIELSYDFHPACQHLLLGDPGRVRQVVLNLLGNAVKFTDAGEVVVTAGVMREDHDHVRVRIAVRDTGIGIPPDAHARLFRPFVQVDGSATRRFGGTGLGLAITRQLVQAMAGELDFVSEAGRGSTFWVDVEFARRAPLAAPAAPAFLKDRRVLVVESHASTRGILVRQLTAAGMIVTAVDTSAAALTRVESADFPGCDVAVIDAELAGGDGLECAAALRGTVRMAQLPVLVLATAVPALNRRRAAGGLVAGFLPKPVGETRLLRAVFQALSFGSGGPGAPAVEVAADAPAGSCVLLVEDNEANRRVAAMLLGRLGYDVDVVNNGHEALSRLAQGRYAAVLMDCQMPQLDGFETTRWIRGGRLPGVDPRVPVIALTAYARPEDRARCAEAGMDGYVAKPIRVAELSAALRAATSAAGHADARAAVADTLDPEIVATARSLPGLRGASLLPELVEAFLAEEPAQLDVIDRLLAMRARDDLAAEAHALGGNAAAFGGVGVRRVALELEEAARAERWRDAELKAEELHEACRRLRAAIPQLGLTS